MSTKDLESTYYNDYLAEVNNFFTKDITSQKMYDLITPIRNLFINNKEILSYSFCRHFGGNSQLGFFCEFLSQNYLTSTNSGSLFDENKNYFKKKVPIKFRGVPNLYDLIDQDIEKVFYPIQLKFLTQKLAVLTSDTALDFPEIKKYLAPDYLVEIDNAEFISNKKLYQETLTISQYLEAQDSKQSWVILGLPILFGLQNYYTQISGLNKPTISWILVEELLRLICLIHQLNSDFKFKMFLYQSKLSEKDEFSWLQLNTQEKLQRIKQNSEIEQICASYIDKYYQSSLLNLENLNLSEKFKILLREVLNWVKVNQ